MECSGRDSESPSHEHQERTDDVLLADLQRVARQVEGRLTEREYTDHGKFGVSTYRRRFGSWNAAKRAADLDTIRGSEVPTDHLLEDLDRVEKQVDGRLTEREYAERGKYGVTTYRRRFGSWNEAKRQAGLQTCKRVDLTEETLAEDLARLVEDIDQPYLTPAIYEERGTYCLSDLPNDGSFWDEIYKDLGVQLTPLYQKFVSDPENAAA